MASLIKRGSIYYLQYCVVGKARRVSTGTESYQLAREKQRQFESAQLRGEDSPLPTRTPLPDILGAYANHVRAVKRPKSAQTDVYYLRHMFGPVCPELQITSRKVTDACLKRKPKPVMTTRSTLDTGLFIDAATTSAPAPSGVRSAGRPVVRYPDRMGPLTLFRRIAVYSRARGVSSPPLLTRLAAPSPPRRLRVATVTCLLLWVAPAAATEAPAGGVAAAGDDEPYAWTCVTAKAAFAPRDGAGALTFNGRMWLIGGWHPKQGQPFPRTCTNEVWSSRDGRDWVLEKPNTFLDATFDAGRDWEGRHTAGYVVHDGHMWIVGGDPIQGHHQSDVWRSADGRTWEHVNRDAPAPPWAPRALAYTAAFDGWIWVIGGQTMPAFAPPAEERFYRDVWRSRDGVRWERVEPREPFWPQRGMIGGSAVLNGRLWVLGGGTYDTPRTPARKFFNDVWSSADGVRWRRHADRAPWPARQYHEVAAFDDKLWVMGGFDGRNRNDVWFSADGTAWHELPGTPWAPRHAASVFVHDGALWVVTGNNLQSDVWRLDRRAAAAGGPPSE